VFIHLLTPPIHRFSLTSSLFFLLIRPPPTSTLFPYTTLFRSRQRRAVRFELRTGHERAGDAQLRRVQGAGYRVAVGIELRPDPRSEEHTSELQSHLNLVCRLLLEKKKTQKQTTSY